MEAVALKPIRVRSTGQEFFPGDRVEGEEAKLLQWSEKGLIRIVDALDPVLTAERIGIRFEQEIPIPDGPDGLGKPIFVHLGHVLSWETDPPYVRVYAWVLTQISHMIPVPINRWKVMQDCQLTASEVADSLARLERDGDIVRSVEHKRELFQLLIKYPD